MKAVVLVGGEGTRMRPLTETIPKPLLPFMNRPFLDHVLDHLAGHGVEEVVCSSPYLESVFHDFLESRRGRPPRLRWITEATPLGTAGAIAGAREHLDDTFLALNGDVLTDLDIGELVTFHRENHAIATITLTEVEDARAFGLVAMDPEGKVLEFREKPSEPVPGTINAGTYVLEPEVLEEIPAGMVSIERDTFPLLIAGRRPVFGFVSRGYWRDLGTPEAYLAAHVDALDGRIRGYETVKGPLLGEGVSVAPAAEVSRHVVAGRSSEIAAGARVEATVIHEGARIGTNATVTRSVLGPRSVVGEGAELRGTVLAEGSSVAAGVRAENARVSSGARLEGAPAGQ